MRTRIFRQYIALPMFDQHFFQFLGGDAERLIFALNEADTARRKRFSKPVTAFMEKRQAYYAGLEADAQAKLREAEQKEQQAEARLSGMQAEAEQLRAEALKQADAEAAARLAAAEEEKQKLLPVRERRRPARRMLCCARPMKSWVRLSPTRSINWFPTQTILIWTS